MKIPIKNLIYTNFPGGSLGLMLELAEAGPMLLASATVINLAWKISQLHPLQCVVITGDVASCGDNTAIFEVVQSLASQGVPIILEWDGQTIPRWYPYTTYRIAHIGSGDWMRIAVPEVIYHMDDAMTPQVPGGVASRYVNVDTKAQIQQAMLFIRSRGAERWRLRIPDKYTIIHDFSKVDLDKYLGGEE